MLTPMLGVTVYLLIGLSSCSGGVSVPPCLRYTQIQLCTLRLAVMRSPPKSHWLEPPPSSMTAEDQPSPASSSLRVSVVAASLVPSPEQ